MGLPLDWLALHARLSPDRRAADDLTHARHLSFAEFDAEVARFCAELRARAVGEGDRVAALSRNRIELVALHLACARIGAIYVPLNWRLSPAELKALVADCEPSLVLGDERLDQADVRGIGLEHFCAAAGAQSPDDGLALHAKRSSLLLYTSGTSGKPKGVLLSEDNLLHTAINFSILGRVTHESVFLCDAPMFHVIGMVANVRPTLMQGGRLVVSDGFEPARTLARLCDQRLGVTHYFCVPQMAAALRALPDFDPAPLRRMTAIFTGGAPHPAANIRAWLEDGVAIVDGYGMSEAGTVFGMPIDRDEIAKRPGAVGLAAPNLRTRIVDARGRVCAPGVAGELQVKGPSVAKGYWRRPEATRAAYARGGWFRTGDIVSRDAQGFHWIVDRKKEMYISGGENVFPAEVEAALAGCPGVVECAVIGAPDEKWGEVGCLFVVAAGKQPASADALLAHLGDRLARYKLPKQVWFVNALPRNGAGKVVKATLHAWATGEAPPSVQLSRAARSGGRTRTKGRARGSRGGVKPD